MHRVVFRDLLFLMLLGFLAMVVWMLPHLNPPAKDAAAEPPGNLIVAITWPEGNTDVDLWVMGPQEIRPVGYSNKGGILFNLLRDDLGTMPDATPLNYENAYTRGIVEGEYVVNVHCYRCPVVPVPVDVEISVNSGEPGKESLRAIAAASVTLDRNGVERTALRFKLTSDGLLVAGSMNNVFRPLRAASGVGGFVQ
jgi:hypothetical protein